ncbi:pyridoxamine 5'-phosphate oxidase family protein [Roseibium litorale]|uniref:Pyridoxamine 5'-phosphate oxidase family protein n=1 Tax=Roseibium litorale TaxID=2803841 RepID=A0ABR9CUW9_9HYPH|nr:pyridoxamine 5'-phosphate oxidase family protein [Roseibium litorale]MBD8894309.1 pyridoxamine 5'-phosphate oxidase family protein [Roseibium litorale]
MSQGLAAIAFTPAVRARQEEEGASELYAQSTYFVPGKPEIGLPEREFIEARDGFYLSTVSETGWPYSQFKGGPQGFLKVLDRHTLGYAEFRGNRQYISSGNLTVNDRAFLFLMDYANRRRMKVWAKVRELPLTGNEDLAARLIPDGYRALPERLVVLDVETYDWNCPSHIPQKVSRQAAEAQISRLLLHIRQLEEENAELKSFLAPGE